MYLELFSTKQSELKAKAVLSADRLRGASKEIIAGQFARMKSIRYQIQKNKTSIKRANNHQKSEIFGGIPELERGRPKLRIPPLDEDDSSATYYTSDSDSDDSIPSVDWDT